MIPASVCTIMVKSRCHNPFTFKYSQELSVGTEGNNVFEMKEQKTKIKEKFDHHRCVKVAFNDYVLAAKWETLIGYLVSIDIFVLKVKGATRDLTFMFWIFDNDCACGMIYVS